MSIPEEEEIVEAIVIRDEPRLASSKSSRRSKSSESTAVWGVVALIGVTVGGYVLMNPPRPAPGPEPVAPVIAAPEPEPAVAPRPSRSRTRSAPPGIAKTDPLRRTVVNRIEPERKAVDPREGFETGEAFDNPPSPGRYGARSSGLLERATPAPRPNVPDPSFGRTPR